MSQESVSLLLFDLILAVVCGLFKLALLVASAREKSCGMKFPHYTRIVTKNIE